MRLTVMQTSQLVALFSALLAAHVLSTGCRRGPRLRLEPSAGTIQTQCGVTSGTDVSEAQATCIAMLVGFSSGVQPWTIKEELAESDSAEPIWAITSTTKAGYKPEYCGAAGLSLRISKVDGRILSMLPWQKLCIRD